MEVKPKLARGLALRSLLVLLTLGFAASSVFANIRNAPPPPTVTSPVANSRLPDPGKVTIKGSGTSLGHVRLRIDVSHVKNGKRVDGNRSNNRGNLGVRVPDDGKEWQVEMALPKMDRGWVDVRYTITAQQFWNKDRTQPHISDAGSTEVTFDVFPQAQPEPLPVAPPVPVIQTPTSGTVLKREPNIHITGTGTPGNQVQVSTQLFYAVENSPGQERKNNGVSTKVDIDKSGKWQVHLGYGGFTEPDYLNPRVLIVAKEIHRESSSLVSHETIREVPVEVPAKRAPTREELISEYVKLPDHVIASANRIGEMTPAQRDALTRRGATVTSPTAQSIVSGSIEPKGTAAAGSNVEVSIKRSADLSGRAPGRPARKAPPQDLGTFTTRANGSGEWKIRALTLPALRSEAKDVSILISVVEINTDGSKGSPHTVTVKQGS